MRISTAALLSLAVLFSFASCTAAAETESSVPEGPLDAPPEGEAVATFAGGCFWCMEQPFERLDGVREAISGYTGGETRDPSYEEVSSAGTGHYEAVRIVYDPSKTTYEELLEVFWHNVDPTDSGGQFCDRGPQYRTAIFVHGEDQQRAAETSLAELRESKPFSDEIVTPILAAGPFWPAEEYHQDFAEKNPVRYTTYRTGCRRDARLEELWGETSGH